MSGFSSPAELKPADYRGKELVGKVEDNNDPEQLSRLRIRVPGIYGDTPTDQLPWAIPRPGREGFAPGNTDVDGSFGVPEIGSVMAVVLQDGHPYFPMYGECKTPATVKAEEKVNYPNRYGFRDKTGTVMYFDKQAGDMYFHHSSGFEITCDKNGNVVVNVPGNMQPTIKGNLTAEVDGTANITVKGDTTLTLQGKLTGNVTGDANLTLNGALNAQIGTTAVYASAQSTKISAGTTLTLQAPTISLLGAVTASETMAVTGALSSATSVADPTGTMQGMRSKYDSHDHTFTDSNGDSGTTSTPTPQM